MKEITKSRDRMTAAGISPMSANLGNAHARGDWKAEFRDPQGNLIAEHEWENLIVNTGLDTLLSSGLVGGSWYIGLTGSAPTPAGGDTMASHAGWSEVASYDETARIAWTPGAVASQKVNNNASAAVFTITNNSTTIGGAFLTSDPAKSGTAGTLFAIGAFEQADVTLSAGSTITVTAEFTQAAV